MPICAPDVPALLLLPGSRYPVALVLPLTEEQRLDVHRLRPLEESPGAFATSTSVLVGFHRMSLTLAVFRSQAPGLFLALPYTGDPETTRAQAAHLRAA